VEFLSSLVIVHHSPLRCATIQCVNMLTTSLQLYIKILSEVIQNPYLILSIGGLLTNNQSLTCWNIGPCMSMCDTCVLTSLLFFSFLL
jgi:hypothetical protein